MLKHVELGLGGLGGGGGGGGGGGATQPFIHNISYAPNTLDRENTC